MIVFDNTFVSIVVQLAFSVNVPDATQTFGVYTQSSADCWLSLFEPVISYSHIEFAPRFDIDPFVFAHLILNLSDAVRTWFVSDDITVVVCLYCAISPIQNVGTTPVFAYDVASILKIFPLLLTNSADIQSNHTFNDPFDLPVTFKCESSAHSALIILLVNTDVFDISIVKYIRKSASTENGTPGSVSQIITACAVSFRI